MPPYIIKLTRDSFQEAQLLSPIQTSIRFLPTVACGIVTNIVTGFSVKYVSANVLVTTSTILTGVAYLLMAIADVNWPYWYAAFPAILLSPICSDGMQPLLPPQIILL